MLVLSRHRHESILIGDDIKVQVIEIRRGEVRLGIECPKRISVDREEIRRLKEEQPTPAEAACDGRGLAGAGYEQRRYQSLGHEMFEDLTEEDDQPLQDKINDELEGR